jgi:hypothetical protein
MKKLSKLERRNSRWKLFTKQKNFLNRVPQILLVDNWSVQEHLLARITGQHADMINKMKIVEEESDETEYWLELLVEANLVPQDQIAHIYKETDEILAMTIGSIKTLRNRKP